MSVLEKKREGKGENPETKPNPVSPPKPEAAQPFSSIPFPRSPFPRSAQSARSSASSLSAPLARPSIPLARPSSFSARGSPSPRVARPRRLCQPGPAGRSRPLPPFPRARANDPRSPPRISPRPFPNPHAEISGSSLYLAPRNPVPHPFLPPQPPDPSRSRPANSAPE